MNNTHKKKSGFLRILLIMMLFALALVCVALAVKSGQQSGLSGLWQSITGTAQTTEFYYENSNGGSFEVIDNGFAVMSSSGLYVFDEQGEETFSRIFSYGDPALWVSGKYGVACDIGGNSVVFFSSDKVISEFETQNTIISASVNSDGYMCICTEESGYMGSVTVLNPNGTDIYKWYSGSARVLSADVKGGSELLVLTVGAGGSRLVLMSLSSEQEQARYEYGGLVIDAAFTDSGIAAVSTSAVLYLSGKLEESAVYDFSGRYLEAYDIEEKFVVLALSDYQVGGDRAVVTVENGGNERGSAAAEGNIISLDASKDGVAVLCSGVITVYDLDMTVSAATTSASGTESVALRNDGTVMAAGAFSAYVYDPSEEG